MARTPGQEPVLTEGLNEPLDGRGRSALIHAAYAKATCVPGEDPAELPELLAQFEAYFQAFPGPIAEATRQMAMIAKRLRRLDRADEARVAQAVGAACQDLPEDLRRLEVEVHDLDVEAALADRLLAEIADACVNETRAQRMVTAYAPVLERLLSLPDPVREMAPAKVAIDGDKVMAARRLAAAPFKGIVAAAKEGRRRSAEAAAMVEVAVSGAAERLSRERTMLVKGFVRWVQVIETLRGANVVERMVIEKKMPKQLLSEKAAATSPVPVVEQEECL